MSLVSGGPGDREDVRGPRGREGQTAGRAVGTGRSTALADTLGPRGAALHVRTGSVAAPQLRGTRGQGGGSAPGTEWGHAPTGPEL